MKTKQRKDVKPNRRQCSAVKLNKARCIRSARKDSEYCWQHCVSRLGNVRWYGNAGVQAWVGLTVLLIALAVLWAGLPFGIFGSTKAGQERALVQTETPGTKTEEDSPGIEKSLQGILEQSRSGTPNGIAGEIADVFLAILKQNDVPQWQWAERLQEMGRRHRELLDKWGAAEPGDPAVDALRDEARRRIELGDYDAAGQCLEKAVGIDRKALDSQEGTPDTRGLSMARSLADRAKLARLKLQYEKAIELYSEAAEVLPKSQQAIHAAYLSDLGSLHCAVSNYGQAEPLYRRALEIQEKTLGPDHPDLVANLSSLADLCRVQGQSAQAEPLYKRAIQIIEKNLGPDYPDLAVSLSSLADLYRGQGDFSQAEALYRRATEILEKSLGPNHPDVAVSLDNLAGLYYDGDLYARAKPLLQRALEIREKALGPEHPDVATSLYNLANLYRTLNQNAQAEPLLRRSIAIGEKALGPDHPSLATSLNNLATLYYAQGQYAQAEPLFRRALTILEKSLAPDHPSVAASVNCLAVLYDAQGLYAQAEPLYKRVLAIRERRLGSDHPDVTKCLENLAALCRKTGRETEAQEWQKRAKGSRSMVR